MRHQGRAWLCVLVALCALGPCCGRTFAQPLPGAQSARHRRSLLGATQQISQCDWIAGEGCALHPSYATYALNRTSNDVVAQYVANSLACASVVDKGTCEAASQCFWDPAFTNGQQGCFLHESSLLVLQQQCVQQQHLPALSKLQACSAARRSCQCSSSSASSCQLHQQQLLGSYSSGDNSRVCQSLLGCWLSSLNGSSTDITQLVEVQLVLVQPKLEQLVRPSSSGRRRALLSQQQQQQRHSGGGSSRQRHLLQAQQLSLPLLDDSPSSSPSSSSSGAAGGGELLFESGSYSPGSASSAPSHSSSSSSSAAPLIGMNGGVPDETGTAGTSSVISVENANNVPGLSASAGGSSSSSDAGYQDVMESGSLIEWEQGAAVDPDQVFGSNGTSSSSGGGSSAGGGSGGDDDSGVQMTGGNAPASFWQCAGEAAVKADQARKWADIDYNSKALTLGTWAKVIKPTALVDWGVQVLDCFKSEVAILAQASADPSKPNKESTEYAIVALIRAFSGQADVFRTYLQAAGSGRAASGLDGLRRLVGETFPGQYSALLAKYNSSPAYDRDVMLQAAALIADLQWFSADAAALAAGMPAAQQQEVFEGVISYGEEMIRRTLFWLFHLQFAGQPAHLPGVPAATPESAAVVSAFDGLAAAALPGPVVAADAPAWQQLQGMVAVAAGWVANAAKLAQAVGDKLDGALLAANTIDGLAKAHTNDFWGSRLELARAGASDAARSLALQDPAASAARWAPLRQRQVQLLNLLQQLVMTGSSSDTMGVQLQALVRDMVADAGSYLAAASGSTSAGPAAAAAAASQQRELAASLQRASQLAYLVRQCKGSPAGLKPLSTGAAAAAGIPATSAAACSQLAAETQRIAAQALVGYDVFVASLVEDLNQQWACNAQPAASCSSTPRCKLALAATLAPAGSSASSSAGSSPPSSSSAPPQAELLMEGSAKAEGVYACEAADSTLHLASMPNATKTAIAASPACQQFLLLPACEGMGGAAACGGFSACRWELSAQRNLMHTAGAGNNQSGISGDAAASIAAASGGVCAMDWVAVLQGASAGSYSGLAGMIGMCRGIRDDASCTAQTMLITLEAQAAGGNNMARIWVPVLVVAAVLGTLLFVGAMYWRRRSTAARRAAEEARSASHGRGGKKGKDGKDGKLKGKVLKKKAAKRAEPGSYKPDLMRDSFTDYMRSAPQQFENGVAIAKAAMAAGSLDVGVVVADVAGGRSVQFAAPAQGQYQQGQYQQHQPVLPPAGPGSYRSVSAGGAYSPSLPPLPPAGGSQPLVMGMQQQQRPGSAGGFVVGSGNDLIDLQAADGTSMQQQQQQLPFAQVPSGSIWGAAAGTSATGGLSGGVSGVSGSLLSGGLSGQVDLIDTGASLALTSSLGLVSSLPQHNSIPFSAVSGLSATQQQQQGTGGYGVQSAAAAAGYPGAAVPGLLLPLGQRVSEEPEEGATTPTSSCCHDSVCTFRQGPGSSVGVGSRPPSSTSSWRAGGSRAGARAGSSNGSLAAAGGGGSGLPPALSGAMSGGLSRSSWSSAMSTDMLITQQSSTVGDP